MSNVSGLHSLPSHSDHLSCFLSPGSKFLSETERIATLPSLLRHSNIQLHIRMFITFLQQMTRADPAISLPSPATGCSVQSRMETTCQY